MNSAVRRFPLGGADLVLIGMAEVAQAPANNAVMVITCSAPITPADLRAALDRLIKVCPWPTARLKRSFPWGALHWVVDARKKPLAPAVQHRRAPPSTIQEIVEHELRTPIDPAKDAPIRFLIVDHDHAAMPAVTTIIMTWCHALMDPRGAQNLLRHLSEARHDNSALGNVIPNFLPRQDVQPFLARARIASKCYDLLESYAAEPPRSPGLGAASPGALRFRLESFVDAPALPASERAKHDFWYRLAVVGCAVAELARERRWPDHPLIVPVSLDQRRKGDAEPTFGNTLAIHFARFRPSEATNVEVLANLLRKQITDAMREGAIDTISIGMEFLKFRRPRKITQGIPWAATGDFFSFACADIGPVPPTIDRVFGARVINAYHMATIPPRPGLGVFFNRCGDINNLVVCWAEGALEERHVERIVALVQSSLAWEKFPTQA